MEGEGRGGSEWEGVKGKGVSGGKGQRGEVK